MGRVDYLGSGKNPFIQVPYSLGLSHIKLGKNGEMFTYDSWMMILQVPSCWIYGRFPPVGGFPSTSKWLETETKLLTIDGDQTATNSWVSWVVHQTAAFCSRETYKRHLFLVRNVGLLDGLLGVAGMMKLL